MATDCSRYSRVMRSWFRMWCVACRGGIAEEEAESLICEQTLVLLVGFGNACH